MVPESPELTKIKVLSALCAVNTHITDDRSIFWIYFFVSSLYFLVSSILSVIVFTFFRQYFILISIPCRPSFDLPFPPQSPQSPLHLVPRTNRNNGLNHLQLHQSAHNRPPLLPARSRNCLLPRQRMERASPPGELQRRLRDGPVPCVVDCQ
jgi:hypothetical protein